MTQTLAGADLYVATRAALPRSRRLQFGLKRVMDVCLAVPALIILSPFLVAIGIAVKLDSPGPAIFRQGRVGKDEREFKPFKFRSMYVNNDEGFHRRAIKRLVDGEKAVASDGTVGFKTEEDPRVTKVGRFLRKTGLDELPQIINVVTGEMSIVGPRPAIPYELEFYKDWYYKRFAVRPGITGLWQVTRHRTKDLQDIVVRDIEYIDTYSIGMDIRIILQTIPRILFRGWSF